MLRGLERFKLKLRYVITHILIQNQLLITNYFDLSLMKSQNVI